MGPKPCKKFVGNDKLCYELGDNEYKLVKSNEIRILGVDNEHLVFVDKYFEWDNILCDPYLKYAPGKGIQILYGYKLCRYGFNTINKKCFGTGRFLRIQIGQG